MLLEYAFYGVVTKCISTNNIIFVLFPTIHTHFNTLNNPSTLQRSMWSYRFEFLPVDLPAVEQQSSNGVSCPGCLQGGRRHIQKVLEHKNISNIGHQNDKKLTQDLWFWRTNVSCTSSLPCHSSYCWPWWDHGSSSRCTPPTSRSPGTKNRTSWTCIHMKQTTK